MVVIQISLVEKIRKLIALKVEDDYWDFKQEWHQDNERLLVDILSFANTVHEHDCYLIIGVSDNGEVVGVSEEGRKRQADVLDLLSNTVFAGDNVPEVRVDTLKIAGKEVDVLTVLNSFNTPFYLKTKSQRYHRIKEGYIYARTGDRNTPISQNANYQQIEMLWKKRLGLTKPPLLQIQDRLKNKLEWTQNEGTYYNIYKPEFKLVVEDIDDEWEDRRSPQFYSFSQVNSSTSHYNLKIMCHETILKELYLVVLDSGRLITSMPEQGFICKSSIRDDYKYAYRFFVKGSLNYRVQEFFYDEESDDARIAKRNLDEVILYYVCEEEREAFEIYASYQRPKLDKYFEDLKGTFFDIDRGEERERVRYRESLVAGLVLNKLLKEFREERKLEDGEGK